MRLSPQRMNGHHLKVYKEQMLRKKSREKGTLLNCCWKGKLVQLTSETSTEVQKTKNRINNVVVIPRQTDSK